MNRKVPRFLQSGDAALRWAKKNVGDVKGYIQQMNKEHPGLGDEFYGRRAEAYSDFAREAYKVKAIDVYRAIQVPVRNDALQIAWSNLGKYWSQTDAGAGVYGNIPHSERPLREVLLRGAVEPRYIDWEHGFISFMYYGEDQWEVSLLPMAPVLVTHVDYEELADPILGNAGPAKGDWQPLTHDSKQG